MKTILLSVSVFLTASLFSQNTYINANNAKGLINSNGEFFNDATSAKAAYGMVSDSNAQGIYASSFWIAGLDPNDSLHTCLTKYGVTDLKSGPITQDYYNANYLNTYNNKTWSVTLNEINYHIAHYNDPNYNMPNGILNWPAHGNVAFGEAPNLAQFVDVNTNGIYEPQFGDYPLIRGNKMVYLIFNDDDAYSPTNTMGFEYHFMVYQYASNDDYLNNTTFLRLTIFNRSGIDYHNVRVANYTDFDIGGANDDYVGSDSTRNMIFGYNGDAVDDVGSSIKFGINPPAFGIKQLNQPMDVAMLYSNGNSYLYSDPTTPHQTWNHMNGYWNDTIHLTYDSLGSTGTILTNYAYSGNPFTQTGWSEVTSNNTTGDRRIMMSTGNGYLANGQSVCIDYAFIYARNGGDYLANVNALYAVADSIQDFYDGLTGFYCPDGNILLNTEKINQPSKELLVYPNPNNGSFKINFNGNYNIKLYTLNGQLKYTKKGLSNQAEINLELPPGLYILQVENKGQIFYKKIVIK